MRSTTRRVPAATTRQSNDRIRRQMEADIAYYASHPDEIGRRLRDLDEEWDIERTLEANAASLALGGLIWGTLLGRKWLVLPLLVGGFLLQHAVQGWCPPVALLRRLGVRTMREIDEERYALKALRGDFREIREDNGEPAARTTSTLKAVRA